MQYDSVLIIEITLASPGVFRVTERSSGASSAVHKVAFKENDLDALIAEMHRNLFDINTNDALPVSSFRRLGAQIAALALPPGIYAKLEQASNTVLFYLDDYSLRIPVEILPCQDSVLAERVPVIRHWLYEANQDSSRENGTANERAAKRALIVADPAGDLPSAAAEGQSVMQLLREKKTPWQCRYLGHSVTAEKVTRELPDTELLHIAAHYHTGRENEGHGISLSDGVWLPDRIPHTPDILFLNCCRAGQIGKYRDSQSLIGKFLQQGTQHIIAPFLPTSDVIAKRFADEFYRVFDGEDTVAESVLKARQALGAIGLLYLHYGAQTGQIDTNIFPAKRTRAKYRSALFIALLALFAVAGMLAYQRSKSSQELERQLDGIRLQTEQAMKQQIEEARIQAAKEEEEQRENERLQRVGEMLDWEDAQANRVPGRMHTLMGEAVKEGDIPVIEVILSRGYPINGADMHGTTAFGHAVEAGQVEVMDWLKEHGADIYQLIRGKIAPFHIGAFARSFPVMEWFYKNGVDVNVQDNDGHTAMMYAASKNFVDVMQWLYDRGAKLGIASNRGVTALSLAREKGNAEAVRWLEKMSSVQKTRPNSL